MRHAAASLNEQGLSLLSNEWKTLSFTTLSVTQSCFSLPSPCPHRMKTLDQEGPSRANLPGFGNPLNARESNSNIRGVLELQLQTTLGKSIPMASPDLFCFSLRLAFPQAFPEQLREKGTCSQGSSSPSAAAAAAGSAQRGGKPARKDCLHGIAPPGHLLPCPSR